MDSGDFFLGRVVLEKAITKVKFWGSLFWVWVALSSVPSYVAE